MKYSLFTLLFFNGFIGFCQTPIADSLDQIKNVDFKKAQAEISIIPQKEKVSGNIRYEFEILGSTDSIYVDARNMKFDEVLLNKKPVAVRNTGQRLWVKKSFQPAEKNTLQLKFSGTPRQAMYFINWQIPDSINAPKQVWTQGQGKYTSNWLPSFDDQREKVEFDLSIGFPNKFKVIANGKLVKKEENESTTRWHFDMQQPMSSYLLALAAGDFIQQEKTSASGVPLELNIEKESSENLEPTYRYTKKIFDFLEAEIGVAYPWQNYKQLPVRNFLYAGMENTGTTIFAHAFITDSVAFKDRNYVSVNAHELAHQWFGNTVTAKANQDHWLHEGFATFYALLAEREVFGDDYYYWKLYQSAEELKELSNKGKGEAVTQLKASSLTYYQKGAWALHILREKVGKETFNLAVKNYLELYKYKTVSTNNFIAEVESVANVDLSDFMHKWINQADFQGAAALNSLKKSQFIKNYLEIAALREAPFQEKAALLSEALDFPVNDYIGQEVVYQLAGETSKDAIALYKRAFESNNIYVRQGIATSMEKIPKHLKPQFESLLKDASYITKETALLKLWMNYPKDVNKYLETTKGVQGFTNKNVRLLWLTLNLVTPGYEPQKQKANYKELSGYTEVYYPMELRKNAFGYLYQINSFTTQNLLDLLQSTQHHDYKFRNFCRELTDELLKNEKYKQKFLALSNRLSQREQDYLQSKLQ